MKNIYIYMIVTKDLSLISVHLECIRFNAVQKVVTNLTLIVDPGLLPNSKIIGVIVYFS